MESHGERDEIERRLRPQQDEDDVTEEQGSAAKEEQPDRGGVERDPEEEGSAGRPQR